MACLGPPPPPPPRGKRGWRGDAAPPDTLECVALGAACELYQGGPALEEMLRPWAGDVCITIDRWDARNLLDAGWVPPAPGRGWCSRGDEEEGVSPAVLEAERFGDLRALEDAERDEAEGRDAKRQRQEQPQSPPPPPPPDAAPFAAVPLAYPVELPPPPPEPPYEPAFEIPERFSAPSSRPRSAREGAVVARTAAFVRSSGPQSEIVLRVRHADAPAFAFLQPAHPLHAFFRYMVDADPEARAAEAKRTLALLSAYGEAEGDAEAGDQEGAEAAERARDAADAAAAAPAEAVPVPADAPAPSEPVPAEETAAAPPPVPPPPPAALAPNEASAETVAVMDKLVAFVLKSGPEFEATLRRRQGASPAFAFLQPWSPLNALYVRKLAAARAAAEAEAAAAAAAAAPPPKPRRPRWDIAAPAASTQTAPAVVQPPSAAAPVAAVEEEEVSPEEAAAAAAAAAEEERRLERLRRVREFSAKRAADARTAAVSAHASRASAHRNVFSVDDDDDLLLPDCDAPPPAPLPPPPALLRRVEPRAGGASLADAHAAALTAAARAARVAPAPPRAFPPHS